MANIKKLALISAGVAAIVTTSTGAKACHRWRNYHWARATPSFDLQDVNSVSSTRQNEYNISLSEWSQSSKLELVTTSADDNSRTRKQRRAVAGKRRVCNAACGNTGWLGLASINLDSSGHIARGAAKVNDTCASCWADPNEKRHVMCQEIGHVFHLGRFPIKWHPVDRRKRPES